MRKAFTLVEMLVLIAVAPVIMVIISRLFATFIRDIPRETRVVQQNTTVQDMLVQLRRDVDRAVALPERFGEVQANETTLLIQQPQAAVCYRFEPGRTVRTLLTGAGSRAGPVPTIAGQPQGQGQPPRVAPTETSDPNASRVWRMPDAVVTCRPWVRDDAAYAVELHAHVEKQVGTRRKDQLANSYVFFIHGLGKGGEVE